jgi:hypothetical integral membrane protein (TIGR02206 family)
VILAEAEFVPYGSSHLAALAVTVLGSAGLVWLGRRGSPASVQAWSRGLAVVILVLNVVMEIWAFRLSDIANSLPLQLSDLAPFAAGIALWARTPWAAALTYYWGLTLSIQALITPVYRGPVFGVEFLAFFAIHLLVVCAAIFLAWGLRLRPSWSGYRVTVVVTVCWAAAMLVVNHIGGSNYGFLNRKPPTGSVLDWLGPWPWYLLPEAVLVLSIWALMTVLWPSARTGDEPARRSPRPSSDRTQ